MVIVLDGNSLTVESLHQVASEKELVEVAEVSLKRIQEARDLIDRIVAEKRVVYGVSTGFGSFHNVVIGPEETVELQYNLIRSHACGVGAALPLHRVRALLCLRINCLCKGNSGCRIETLETLVAMLNKNCLPLVPEQGTVGASGDLCPLSHVALGAIGEGQMWDPEEKKFGDAGEILKKYSINPVVLQSKEGLALINGTQFMTSLGAEALYRAEQISRQADVIACLTHEVLRGIIRAYDPRVHLARGQVGQIETASRLVSLLLCEDDPKAKEHGAPLGDGTRVFRSEVSMSALEVRPMDVQDAYSLRCIPQVHGVVRDTLKFVRSLLEKEMNAATDNPMIFPPDDVISGGNFHGEYPAKACDILGLTVSELATISERRINRMVHPAYSNLPPFLTVKGGLHSGFMIPHYVAASIVSENKVLCHPASCDSISTSGGQEDHVSMGGFAARKSLQIVENVEKVLAIELLSGCHALDLLRPLHTTSPLEAVYNTVRKVVPKADGDHFLSPEINDVWKLLVENRVWDAVKEHLKE
eukprot:TRINITY_DN181_c0_g1_i8.p1 TRINITY_DN181_c0_g1~~TRINITY_DN181_c0_g1_i8.p1  ORF type:complete len:531 (+),score=144.93 TRINITY_DN181_c0_g1_i8:1446-3038(+)